MSHRTDSSARHSTVLLWGKRHPYPKLYLEIQENAGAEGRKKKKKNKEKGPSGYTTFCESHLMLLSWFPLPWLLYQVPGCRQGLL